MQSIKFQKSLHVVAIQFYTVHNGSAHCQTAIFWNRSPLSCLEKVENVKGRSVSPKLAVFKVYIFTNSYKLRFGVSEHYSFSLIFLLKFSSLNTCKILHLSQMFVSLQTPGASPHQSPASLPQTPMYRDKSLLRSRRQSSPIQRSPSTGRTWHWFWEKNGIGRPIMFLQEYR